MRVLSILLVLLSLLFHANEIKGQSVNLNGLELWLKNDFGVITSGGFVTQWKDASGHNNDCIQTNPSFQPAINQNIIPINNNSSLVFDGVDDYMPFTVPLTNIRTVFFVIKHNGINVPFAPILGDNVATDFLGDDIANNIFGGYTSPNITNGSIRINKTAVTTVTSAARPLTYSIISLTTTGNVSAGQITRDRANTNRVWGGEYSEVMIYSRLFNLSQIDSIENYLVNKYSPILELGSNVSVPQLNGCIPSTSVTLTANPDFQAYLWSNGNMTNQITVNQYGEYSVICTDLFGINHYDTIQIVPTPKNFNYPNTIMCGNNPITWNTQLNKTENDFQWQDNSTDSLLIINSPGQYSVTVIDTFGCVYNSNLITIAQDNFANTISLGNDTSLCAGNSITLASGNNASLTYTWSTGSTNDTLPITLSGTYSIVVTNTNNCTAIDSINVFIAGQAPTANFSTNIGCVNKIVSFVNSSIAPTPNSIDSTFWDFGDPMSSINTSTVTNPAHTYSTTGTYTVTMRVKTNAGCEQTIVKTINIYPVPTATFISSVSCQNDTTTFLNQSTSVPGYSVTSLLWNFGDPGPNNFSTLNSPKHVFSNQVSYFVNLTATNDVGCSSTITRTVIVRAQVKADFVYSAPCANVQTFFQSTSIAPLGTTYSWNFGNSYANTQNAIKTFTSSGVFAVTFTIAGGNGCTSSITKYLNVFLSPVASFTVPSFCSKDTIQITEASNPQSGIISSYHWRINNNLFSTIPSPSLSLTTAGTYSVKLSVSNSFGCKDSLTKPVTVFPLPNVDFTTNPAQYYYINSPVSFIPTIANASAYAWSVTSFSTSTSQSPTYTFDTIGSYVVLLNLKDQNGCKNSKTKTITVLNRYLDLGILNVVSQKDADGFITVKVDMANYGSVPISTFDIHYQISDGGNIKETWNGNLTPYTFYSYTFVAKSVTTKNSSNHITCVELEKINNTLDENITNNSLCNTLNTDDIFVSNPLPNPAEGDIVLPVTLNRDLDYTIEIYNSTGQIQYEETLEKGLEGLNFVKLPTNSYARGCYIIKVMIDGKIYIKKFIKVAGE